MILPDEKTALIPLFGVVEINGVMLKLNSGGTKFYSHHTEFSKAVCKASTEHPFVMVGNKVNITN